MPDGNLVCSVCDAPFTETPSQRVDLRSPLIKFIERLTVIFAVIAVLSPFFAVLGPLVLTRLSTTEPTGPLIIHDAWVRPAMMKMPGHNMPNMPDNTAAYLTIENIGPTLDRLLRVTTDAATTVEIHKTVVDDRDVAQMQLQPDGIEIPAKSTVSIDADGYHIMLSEMSRNLEIGDAINLSLIFASGQTLKVEAVVSDLAPKMNAHPQQAAGYPYYQNSLDRMGRRSANPASRHSHPYRSKLRGIEPVSLLNTVKVRL